MQSWRRLPAQTLYKNAPQFSSFWPFSLRIWPCGFNETDDRRTLKRECIICKDCFVRVKITAALLFSRRKYCPGFHKTLWMFMHLNVPSCTVFTKLVRHYAKSIHACFFVYVSLYIVQSFGIHVWLHTFSLLWVFCFVFFHFQSRIIEVFFGNILNIIDIVILLWLSWAKHCQSVESWVTHTVLPLVKICDCYLQCKG